MALPYEVTFTVQDGEGNKSSSVFFISSGQTPANALVEAEGMLQDIADLTIGQIVDAQMLMPVDLTGLTSNGAADAFANRHYKFRMTMQSAEGHPASFTIPAADVTKTVGGTNLVNKGTGTPGEALALGVITRPITTAHDEDVTVVTKFYEVNGK